MVIPLLPMHISLGSLNMLIPCIESMHLVLVAGTWASMISQDQSLNSLWTVMFLSPCKSSIILYLEYEVLTYMH